ncbi:MAG: hypothetical protein FE78DRAFT_29090 [Acidomyces sp. 'richmondensis']|nr:MAG: hypothetical protein FE78DRAFT_29090 [Acidomyces sp. 'richmondensis']
MSAARDEFDQLMDAGYKERRTGHPADDDDDETRSFLNLSDEEDHEDVTPPASHADPDEALTRTSLSQARTTIPLTRYGANTGPKGVISDAQHFRDSRRLHRISMRSTSTLASRVHNGMPVQEPQVPGEKLDESDEEDFDDDLDNDFMKQWRSNRLRELQSGQHNGRSRHHTREPSRRMYGGLPIVDGDGYLDAVDKSPPDVVVVVYIYDDYSEVSTLIEDCVRGLARKHLDTRFVKLHYQDAEMEPAGVPALLAYRGGNKFAGLVPIIQDIPEDADVSEKTLETVLRRYQILR